VEMCDGLHERVRGVFGGGVGAEEGDG